VGQTDAIGIVDEHGAVGDDGVVDGVPVTSQARRRPRSRCSPSARPARSPNRPARSVNPSRGEAIVGSSTVHTAPGTPATQTRRCLRHTSRAWRPKAVRSTSESSGRSLTRLATPQPAPEGRCASRRAPAEASRRPHRRPDQNDHRRKSDQQLVHARRVDFHRGLSRA
jgi:hypothetical protein